MASISQKSLDLNTRVSCIQRMTDTERLSTEAPSSELADALPAGDRRVRVPLGEGQLGWVRLVDTMPRLVARGGLGPEAAIVQAARVSYGAGTRTARSDTALLRFLLRNEHMTPFEMVVLKFHVRAPLFTARQWMRHRAGAFNEESARYSEIGEDRYVPAPDEVKAQAAANRQGSGAPLDAGRVAVATGAVRRAYDAGVAAYAALLTAGVSRELARIVLPEGRYTQFYWTVNLRNLFHFLDLRCDAHAQENIRAYAGAVRELVRAYCPVALAAFDDYVSGAVTLSGPEIRAMRPDAGAAPELSAAEQTELRRKRARLGLDEAAPSALA